MVLVATETGGGEQKPAEMARFGRDAPHPLASARDWQLATAAAAPPATALCWRSPRQRTRTTC
eukprot:scaffold7080_cov302-Pinguiococcus_pyrenoidosus.AAC.3